ncbi:MAG: extracellular solute-binding protein [Armatimonadetes bacterium]|nr:extracellular solute-binding protein [Armatimonadota bacterium]
MSTKASLILLVAICVVLGFLRGDFLCGTSLSHKTEISFWNGFTGPDGVVMLRMIREFNQENPDVEVTMQRIPWALYYNKVMVSGLDGRGPEVFVVHASALTRMHRAGVLADETSLFEGPDAIPANDFDPYVLDQTIFDGKHFSVPLDIHPQGMYCNADMLKKIGMVNPDGSARPPQTKEEFLRAAHAMMNPPNSEHPDTYGFALTAWQNNFMSLLPQFDGRFLDENGKCDLNNPNNVKALEFLGSLHDKEKLIPPPDNQLGWVGFRQQKVGMVWEGVYMLGDLLRLEGMNYVGAPIPTIGNHPGTLADSHTLCIRPNLNPKQREAVERFIRFLSKNSIKWAAAGQVPARLSVRNTPEFKSMQVQYAFSKQIPYMKYMPRITTLFEMGVEINLAVEKVIRGRTTAKEALDIANANSQKAMDRDEATERRARELRQGVQQ